MRTFLKLSLLHSLVVGGLWLASTPVLAAAAPNTLQVCIASSSVTGCVQAAMSDPDATQFVLWCQSAYPGPIVGGNPTILAAGPCLQAWAAGIFAGTKNNVNSWLKNNAATTAVGAIVPVAIQ